ncbi:STAS-like domain-containing protein [Nostoc sp. DedQUE09]|uniref:STAS-like domain-containing protein n=1 Tax=Nostoc sp. DedQUE09 TaxID=3075394 RepID=UPI002AD2D829|nr:DUF4325 domain-containing protein [Nostoc sp. DedQUE09]MDZ7951372.1 DUF4325 domain-containing protein [Nostoc sp. DedQUE09]
MNSNNLDRRNQERSVWSEDDYIFIQNLSHPRHVSEFLRALYNVCRSGYKDIAIVLKEVKAVFPNACVPIAAIIQYYRKLDFNIEVYDQPRILEIAHFNQPLLATTNALTNEIDLLSKVWHFQDEVMVFQLVSALVTAITRRIECSSGVVEAFEWCLTEVIDNILQHSKASEGFAMVQVHADSKRLAVCIADTGIGIYNSLAQSIHKPRSAVDAITLAVKEGVTRDPQIGQGNGLWGLLEIVKNNSGLLTITSGSASLFIRDNESKPFSKLPYLDKSHQGTIVDFQIDASQGIDIASALSGHKPVNLRLENLETNTGEHCIIIKDHTHGTGTRLAAIQIRNVVLNVINEGGSKVILDFSGIAVISSSFADEFIGKLVVKFGFFNFQNIITLQGMNPVIQGILHRSVAQRMMNSLQEGS